MTTTPEASLAVAEASVQPSIATKPTSSRTEASATETDNRRTEHLRVQALGAALSRRDWSAAERAYEAIRDAFDMLPANVKTDPRNRSESTPPAVLAAPTNESPAPQATKKTYIKPLRTIVEIDERYADQIRDLLNNPAPHPPVEGLADTIARAICCPDGCVQQRSPDFSGKGCFAKRDTFEKSNVGKSTKLILAALASPSLTAGPVAWQRKHHQHGWVDCRREDVEHYRTHGQEVRPLYAALDLQGPGKMDSEKM